jgi:NhaP-type Na+/H+ or K+/H+ antiporter
VAPNLLAIFPLFAIDPSVFDEHQLAIYLGAVGLVVVISGLVSGLVERGPISQVIVFVALGVLVGPWGFDVVNLSVDSPAVETVGTVALVLVFFTDAIKINLGQLKSNWLLPALALGPGAVFTVLLIAGAAKLAFDLSWPLTFLVAAILASTDAVLLRDVVNNRHVPRAVRHTLSVEAGTNDVIVLPLLLIFVSIATAESRSAVGWVGFAFKLYVLGPLVGVAVAYLAIKAMSWLRRRQLIRRDYESIYSIGVSFVAFAAAQLIGGSGFIAAFAAGITIALIDDELCECFLEYGETTAEMAMLLTFVFIGAALIDSAWETMSLAAIAFAVFSLLIARPLPFMFVLRNASISRAGKYMIAWFGPRGLNSLLLAVLAIAAGIPQGERVFGIVSVVVVLSMIVHGGTATPVLSWYGRNLRKADLPEENAADAVTLFDGDKTWNTTADVPRMTVAELNAMLQRGEPVTIIDVRRQTAFERDLQRIPGSIRIPVDELIDRLGEVPRDRPVVLWCACDQEYSSARAALILLGEGDRDVYALKDGWQAWIDAGFDVEPYASHGRSHTAVDLQLVN